MSIEADWQTNKAQCPKCKRHFKIGAFSRDGEKCNSCAARSERQWLKIQQIINDLPDYDAVNWQAYSSTKNHFLMLCGLKRELLSTPAIEATANRMGVNPGLISRVISGGDSPTLRRYFNIPPKEKDIVGNGGASMRSDWIAERDQLLERIEELEAERLELLSLDADDLRLWYMRAGEKFKEPPKPVKPKPTYNKKATQPSPDDIVSFTVKMTRAQREQINETAKGRGVTTKEMICSEYLEGEK